MSSSKRIRTFLGWLLLVVFTTGVTPKIYLHDALGHHRDQRFSTGDQQTIRAFEYSCGFVNVESTSPFIEAAPLVLRSTAIQREQLPVARILDLPRQLFAHTALRGPPYYI
ncbi:hypothetical protein [Niabella beijingensis]|uniref:hypothetical protein n=1 Tax=Niabella beijingensis TaxID=2872700 RepID=UPI001CC0B4F1|nr:hypothetical protein [Niabella beijingensis]MBZ4192347.1 hypothetical protein [Niabella beijingensis]